jgi:hypothetical protein
MRAAELQVCVVALDQLHGLDAVSLEQQQSQRNTTKKHTACMRTNPAGH